MTFFARVATSAMIGIAAVSGCTVLFDYGDRPGEGGAGGMGGSTAATMGGEGGNAGGSGGEGAGDPCAAPDDCSSFESDGPCQTTTCDNNTCGIVRPPAGTPVGTQTAGDCIVVACNDAGEVADLDDETDVPVDGLECTDDVCTGSTPSNPPTAAGASCGMGGALMCDGSGSCVGCSNDTQCLADTDCQDHFCDNTVCNVTVASNGTSCTSDGMFCNGPEQCQNGSCAPSGDPCPGADGDGDCSETCDENNDDCNGNDLNGSACTDGAYCNGSDTCQTGACSGHAGDPCPGPDGDGDCSETCNESANNCTANDANGSMCPSDGAYCNGVESCQSGSCTGAGNPCAGADGDSDCSESCNEGADNCTANDPNGSTCSDGVFCNGGDTCSNGACTGHAGDPCDGADGDGDCSEQCNEGADSCSGNDPNGSSCNDGLYCNGADTCTNGSCGLHTGNPCPGPDGDFDCSESCNELADMCNANDPFGSDCAGNGCCLGNSCEFEPGICP